MTRLISRWLGRHIGNAELRRGIEESGSEGLAPGQTEALAELTESLERAQLGERGELAPRNPRGAGARRVVPEPCSALFLMV
ncbi:MAG: hypothetical protein ABI896_01215 [Actinomycetota bacterium]